MATPSTSSWDLSLTIDNEPVDYKRLVKRLVWTSAINQNSHCYITLTENGFTILRDLLGDRILPKSRNTDDPVLIRFRLGWREGYSAPERLMILHSIDGKGGAEFGGSYTLICVDPISYYLSRGNSSGAVYRGQIGTNKGVIAQVIKDYIPGTIGELKVQTTVADTYEAVHRHYMHRAVPRSFINQLVSWSAPLTASKLGFLITTGQMEKDLYIDVGDLGGTKLREVSDLPGYTDAEVKGPLSLRYGGNHAQLQTDIRKWRITGRPDLSTKINKIVTGGISAVSGRYLDPTMDQQSNMVVVNDDTTPTKPAPDVSSFQSFTKSPKSTERIGHTYVDSIPELNGGELGIRYDRYIDGRARFTYINLLNASLRLMTTISGEPRLFDSSDLGRSKVAVKWLVSGDPDPTSFDGQWLIYGWRHVAEITTGQWLTHCYLARLDEGAVSIT